MHFHFVLKSDNSKTGPIPTVYAHEVTCPDACPLKKNGCYAGLGLTNIFWRRVNRGEGITFAQLLQKVKSIFPGRQSLWRYAVAGDLPGRNNSINSRQLEKLAQANKGRQGFTYTHKPVLFGQASRKTILSNRKAIKKSNKNGFTINLSANNLEHADKLVKLNLGPVVTVLPVGIKERSLQTPGGNTVTVCPATYAGITCAQCQLCAKSRKAIVGFPAHGSGKKIVSEVFHTFSA